MRPGTLVLVHSPLTGAAAWGDLPSTLNLRGLDTLTVEATDGGQAPYAGRFVASAALGINDADPRPPLALVAHSGAGPLLAQVGFAQRAARRLVGAYVFCDAGLPRGREASRLDLLRDEDAAAAVALESDMADGGTFPSWTDDDLADEVPDREARRALVASLRPHRLDYFTEPLPYPDDWPDAPCAYLRTSAAYAVPARTAGHRGWPVRERDLGHFAALVDADAVVDDLVGLLDLL